MKYFLVSWLVSSVNNNGQWISKIIVANSADEALLQDLMDMGCIPAEATMDDIKAGKYPLNYGEANNLIYKADMLDGYSNSEELQKVKTDCGLKVFIPRDIMRWHESSQGYVQDIQPYKVTVAWTVGAVQHTIEDTVWAENINDAAIDGVLGCSPVEMSGYKDSAREILEISNDCSIGINGENYALTKIEPLQHVVITIDGHKIDALITKGHRVGYAPILARVVQQYFFTLSLGWVFF